MCNVQYYADELGCNRQVLRARGRKAHSPHYNAMLYTLELGGLTLFKQGSVCHLSTSMSQRSVCQFVDIIYKPQK